jgi:hypothetical protein
MKKHWVFIYWSEYLDRYWYATTALETDPKWRLNMRKRFEVMAKSRDDAICRVVMGEGTELPPLE